MNLYLHTIIYQIIADLENVSNHYIIYARYLFYGQQMFGYEPVYLNRNSIKDLSLYGDNLRCRMMLDWGNSDDSFSIVIPFESISEIKKFDSDAAGSRQILFLDGSKQGAGSYYIPFQ
ncbi:hypothetical protein [Dyadobacter sp. 3J3]|uniref:hypothetical protein n=1 Tax=Dyadobacter sp. 3J3 TaxID=2606600 RepID=UPI00135793A8|nr:hypothetical protein [Dyadobacter sp. 3J3]